MICKVCRREIEDTEGAIPFMTGGRVHFHTHQHCSKAVRDGGVLIGQAARQLIELRKPGFFDRPVIRGVLAAIKELRK